MVVAAGLPAARAQEEPVEDRVYEVAEPDEVLSDIAAVEAAEKLGAAGKIEEATSAYKRALATFPDSMLLDQMLYRLGELLDAQGRPQEAREYWDQLLNQVPDSPYAGEVEQRLLAIYRQIGELDGALDILLNQLSKAPNGKKAELLEEIANVRLGMGEPERAIKDFLRRQRYLPENRQEEGLAKLREMVDTRIPVDELESISDRFPDPVPGAWILERLTRYYLTEEDLFQAETWAARYQKAFPAEPFAHQVKDLLRAQREAILAHRHRIGVLLNLSGNLAVYGERVRRGIQLAYKQMKPSLPKGELALWVRDLDGEEPLLVGHFRKLVNDADPEVVIGPLLSKDTEAYARAARSLGVPMIAPLVPLPQKAFGVAAGLGISPEMEALAAARYAYRDMGLTRFVVMAPEGAYGEHIAAAFTREFERLGGEVQATEFYAKDGSNARALVRKIVAEDLTVDGVPAVTREQVEALGTDEMDLAGLLEPEEESKAVLMVSEEGLDGAAEEEAADASRTPEEGESPVAAAGEAGGLVGAEPPPREPLPPLQGPPVGPHPYFPGFEGVFLPGPWQGVVLAAPHLPFQDINVPLIGSSGWNDRRLIREGGSAVRGGRFVTAYVPGSESGKAFVDAYLKAYGEDPDLFAALGYDAMNLAVRVVRDSEGEPWERLVGEFDGVTGRFDVKWDGAVERTFSIMKVQRRGFTQVARISAAEELALPAPGQPSLPGEGALSAEVGKDAVLPGFDKGKMVPGTDVAR